MNHIREDLTDEALVARAKASSRCYTARWGVISMLLFEDWAELCGTSVDYLQHWVTGLVCKAMKAAKVHAWVGDNGDGWHENLNGVWIVASDSGGGKTSGFKFALNAEKKKGFLEKTDDTLTNTTMEALVKFLADHGGECLMAMDEAKRFMKMLMGEYSGGKESSAREMFMELLAGDVVRNVRVGAGGSNKTSDNKSSTVITECLAHMVMIGGLHPHTVRAWLKHEEDETDGLMPKIFVLFAKATPRPLQDRDVLRQMSRTRATGPQLTFLLLGITYLMELVAKRAAPEKQAGDGDKEGMGGEAEEEEDGGEAEEEEDDMHFNLVQEPDEADEGEGEEEEDMQGLVIKSMSDENFAKLVCSAAAFDLLQKHVEKCNVQMDKVADIQGNGLQQAGWSKCKGVALKMAGVAYVWEVVLATFAANSDVSEYRGDAAGLKKLLRRHFEVLLDEADMRGVGDGTLGPAHITEAHMLKGIAQGTFYVQQQLAAINNVVRVERLELPRGEGAPVGSSSGGGAGDDTGGETEGVPAMTPFGPRRTRSAARQRSSWLRSSSTRRRRSRAWSASRTSRAKGRRSPTWATLTWTRPPARRPPSPRTPRSRTARTGCC